MYSVSSQRQYWTFKNEVEIGELRLKHNQQFQQTHGDLQNLNEAERERFFITADEERTLVKSYEMHLREFCRRFEPPMPRSVVGTAFHYFKRFYLNNSTMDHHPKEIMATCVYLACKTDEFNVSIGQFVSNIKGDRCKAMDIILSNELLLMQKLNYYLTVHNPYRPVEGFLIDIKTRGSLINPDRLRAGIDEFLERTFLTDACLIFAPSQIALAAVLHAASKEQENLDSYVTESLFYYSKDKLPVLIEAVRKIRFMVKAISVPQRDIVKEIEVKLNQCRNQDNNPDSEAYRIRMKKLLEDEDDMDVMNTSEYSTSDQYGLANVSMRSIDG